MIGIEQFVYSVEQELLNAREARLESLVAGVDFDTYNRLVGEINSLDISIGILHDKRKRFLKEEDDADTDTQVRDQHDVVYRGHRPRSKAR